MNSYIIRPAVSEDAKTLVNVRLQIDGETENMDRERGEAVLDEAAFRKLIEADTVSPVRLFLVAEVNGEIAGFSRCQGSDLRRLSHQVEFGMGVLKKFWGMGIGRGFLERSLGWADDTGLIKMNLKVLETNERAIRLYEGFGFKKEGILLKDKRLSDGNFYNTVVMGRITE